MVDCLQRKGLKIFYFTNNSTRSRVEIYEKLLKMGFGLSVKQVYTSAYATAVYVRQNGIRNVYCIGSKELQEELENVGVSITEDENNVQAVIIGLDTDFTYSKMAKVLHIIQKGGCSLIACNKDTNYPIGDDILMLGCGLTVDAIEASCNTKVDYMVGKPNTFMLELLAKDWDLKNYEILVVGDSYESDIEMAKRYHCPSVLITKEAGFDDKGTTVVCQIKDIGKFF